MKKKFLLQPMLSLLMIHLFSCQRQIEKPPDNSQIVSNVNNWLDKQKSPTQPNKAANIDLLKENIDFSDLRLEDLNDNEQAIVIPIREDYKIKKNIDKNIITVLLLIRNKTGGIIRGNIVLYFPENNQQVNEIPANTFYKMYREKDLDCSGLFRFLSPTGRWIYQREYKNGNLSSFGFVKSSNTAEGRVETDCLYFFLNLYLWVDGIIVAHETIYLGRVCGSPCDNPDNQTLCPDDGGGGNGGAGSSDSNIDDFCISAAISEFQQQAGGAQPVSQTESFTITDVDPITKNKNPKWIILRGAFNAWHLTSQEIGVIKLIDPAENKWAWKSLIHGTISMVGSPLPSIAIEHNQGVGTPSFTPEAAAASNILYGGMSLNFTVVYRLICNCPNIPVVGWVPPIYHSYTSSAIWDANPI